MSVYPRFLFLIVLLIGSGLDQPRAVAVAQTPSAASINGFVRDAETGETLLLANVFLPDLDMGTATNTRGYYTSTGLPPGRHEVRVSYLGFETRRLVVELAAGEALRLDVDLEPEGLLAAEVVVEAARESEQEERRLGSARMNTALIRQLPTILEADVFRSLQLLPGVKAASDYSSGLYVRGGSPDQTLILLDRTTVYNPTHFFGFFSTFNPDAIKDVRLYKGAYPARFGGRIGSVVDIYNKDGDRTKTRGTATLGLLASRAMIEGPHGRGSWMLAIRRSTLEPLLAAARSGDVDGIPDRFYFFDANGKVNMDIGSNDFLSVSFYAGQDILRLPISTDFDVRLRYGNRTVSAGWAHVFSERLFGDMAVTASSYFSVPEFLAADTFSERDNQVRDYSLRYDLQYVASPRREIRTGLWAGAFSFRLADTFDSRRVLTLSENASYGSAYVEERRSLGLLWTLTSGLHASWFGRGDYLRLEPRLALERKVAPNLFAQLGAGRYHQFLTLVTNEAFSGLDVWLTSSSGVPPAWGDQVVAGLKWTPSTAYRFEAEVYYRSMEDLFQLDPFLPDVAGLDYSEFFHFGDGYAVGSEYLLQKERGALTGFVSYTFGVTRRRFENLDGNRFFPPKYDRTHDVNITTMYDLTPKWRLTSVFAWATGQAYTEPASRWQLSNSPLTREGLDVLESPFNAARLPAYHRLDAGATRRGRLAGADFELQIQLINVYGRRNIWFYSFDFEDDGAVDRSVVPQIPIPVPNISFTMRF